MTHNIKNYFAHLLHSLEVLNPVREGFNRTLSNLQKLFSQGVGYPALYCWKKVSLYVFREEIVHCARIKEIIQLMEKSPNQVFLPIVSIFAEIFNNYGNVLLIKKRKMHLLNSRRYSDR